MWITGIRAGVATPIDVIDGVVRWRQPGTMHR
jgi:hypothetical protein